MLSKMFMTLKYFVTVKGNILIPATSFPKRMGCQNSDMFRISLSQEEYPGGISLAEFHAAFLISPIFQLELWLLSKINALDPTTTSKSNLMAVAMGEKSSFGPWTSWAVEGHRTRPILSSSSASPTDTPTQNPPCAIMRCKVNGMPFCDTWWAVELGDAAPDDDSHQRHPELVFGTALIGEESGAARLLIPFHHLYSRLLLASCKATLVTEGQKRAR